jgi:pyruvate dehydrogenase E1 component beta subunit
MREITYSEAVREAIREEMLRDKRVFLIGEDIGVSGGAFAITKGLYAEFGEERVRDTPISEETIIGAAVGAAIAGFKPVAEIMFSDFMTLALDPMANHAALLRYISGGQLKVPMVLRTPICQGRSAGAQHAKSYIAWLMHVPGLKIAVPSTPYDAKGLLKTAIRGEDPTIFYEHMLLYGRRIRGEVPEGDFTVPFGKADVKREGKDVTIVALSIMVRRALAAAEELAKEGISCEVVDPRTLSPLDKQTILNSVKKTGRLVTVETDCKTGGVGAEIAAIVAEEAIDYLDAPIRRVATMDVPPCLSPVFEKYIIPDEKRIISEIKALMG